MAEEISLLQQAFAETGVQLDRIIDAYERKMPGHPETIVEYSNGNISSFNIVGELGQNSIPNKENSVKVEIGTAVTSIGNYAFQACYGLTSITIPDSVTSIRNEAFAWCSGLTSITIPDGVTSIGNNAFSGCSGLTSVTIPNGVTSIGNETFSSCSGLTSITISDSVTSIGYYAFSGCSGLTSITIPDSVTSIGDSAFSGTSIMNTYMTTKSSAEVQAMNDYPWGLTPGGIIHCSDIDFVVPDSGGSGS